MTSPNTPDQGREFELIRKSIESDLPCAADIYLDELHGLIHSEDGNRHYMYGDTYMGATDPEGYTHMAYDPMTTNRPFPKGEGKAVRVTIFNNRGDGHTYNYLLTNFFRLSQAQKNLFPELEDEFTGLHILGEDKTRIFYSSEGEWDMLDDDEEQDFLADLHEAFIPKTYYQPGFKERVMELRIVRMLLKKDSSSE